MSHATSRQPRPAATAPRIAGQAGAALASRLTARLLPWLLAVALPLTPVASAAPALQPLAAIATAAESAARAHAVSTVGGGARVAVTATAPDPRLRLPACAKPLAASVPAGAAARLAVEVRCAAPSPWRVYVPVTVAVVRPVVVTARSLARDTILAPGDVRLAEREVAGLAYGSFAAAEEVVGQRLRRDVAEGSILNPGLVLVPPLVRRGQEVLIEARSPGFSVRVAGVARRDGRLGETIPVQNISSGEVREAVVRSAKSVEVLTR